MLLFYTYLSERPKLVKGSDVHTLHFQIATEACSVEGLEALDHYTCRACRLVFILPKYLMWSRYSIYLARIPYSVVKTVLNLRTMYSVPWSLWTRISKNLILRIRSRFPPHQWYDGMVSLRVVRSTSCMNALLQLYNSIYARPTSAQPGILG